MSLPLVLLLIIVIVFCFNRAMVQLEKSQTQLQSEIDKLNESARFDGVYAPIPDVFERYYLDYNYESLADVTDNLFNGPQFLIYE